MRTSKLLVLSLASLLALSVAAWAHNGDTKFFPEIPASQVAGMVLDGDESDWGWYDESFAIDNAEMKSIGGATVGEIDPNSLNIVYFTAWSGGDDNRFWFFTRIQDDTLKVDTEEPGGWWKDDELVIGFDSDHTGGFFRDDENLGDHEVERNGYFYQWRVLPTNVAGEEVRYHWINNPDWQDNQDLWWLATPPAVDGTWTLSPPDAQHGSTNVTRTHELAFELYDDWSTSRGESIRHIIEADKVIHFGVQFQDGDTNWQRHLTGCREAGCVDAIFRNGDSHSDYFPIPAEDDGTIVETVTWARIKHSMQESLEKK